MRERAEFDGASLLVAVGLGGLLVGSFALLPPTQAGMGTVAAGVALLALFHTRAALYLIIPALTLSPDIPVAGIPIRVEDLFMIPLVAGWLARVCVLKERQRTPLDRILVAYVLVGLVATLWGVYNGTSYFFVTDKDVSAPLHFLKRLEFVLLFFILVDTVATLQEVRRLTYVLMASMLALSGYALSEFISNRYIALAPPGAPVHEPGLASLLNVALGVSLLPISKRSGKVLLGAIILFSLGVLPFSLGRNFFATTMLIMLYVGVFEQRWLLAFLAVPGIIGTRLYPTGILTRLETLTQFLAPTTQYGTEAIQGASLLYRAQAPIYYGLSALGYSPVLGFGLGSLPLGFIDNEYLIQFFYTGLAGAAIFFLFAVRLVDMLRQVRRAARDPAQDALVRGFQLVLVGYAIFGAFNASISATRTGGPFFIIIGLLAVLHRLLLRSSADTVMGAGIRPIEGIAERLRGA